MVCAPMSLWGWNAFAASLGLVFLWAIIFDPFPAQHAEVDATKEHAAER